MGLEEARSDPDLFDSLMRRNVYVDEIPGYTQAEIFVILVREWSWGSVPCL